MAIERIQFPNSTNGTNNNRGTGSASRVGKSESGASEVDAGKQINRQHAAHKSVLADEDVYHMVSQLSDYVQNMERDLQFHVDDSSGRLIIQVIDSESKTILRQIPSEELLQLASSFDSGSGFLVDKDS